MTQHLQKLLKNYLLAKLIIMSNEQNKQLAIFLPFCSFQWFKILIKLETVWVEGTKTRKGRENRAKTVAGSARSDSKRGTHAPTSYLFKHH